ncbi:hypothetical protein [Streptomyces glaucescens]|uniref:hypothetical protein n=1 Tax=Streptomyces glaucescens TaxID=1907 RepID=UPI000A3A68E6|nr:hypothetical protein [Streptomyces glaucescens]
MVQDDDEDRRGVREPMPLSVPQTAPSARRRLGVTLGDEEHDIVHATMSCGGTHVGFGRAGETS